MDMEKSKERVAVTLAGEGVLLDALLEKGVPIAHDCGGTLACATCCVIVREGMEALGPASEDELDMLDRSSAAAPGARLACQVTGMGNLVVEVPPAGEAPARDAALVVSATARAGAYLAAQLARHPGAVAVRLAVEPAGCSGFGYRVAPVDAIRDDDTVFRSGGVRIAVDPRTLPFVQGTVIDLATEGLARRLRFDNPNARQSCGCGESFSA